MERIQCFSFNSDNSQAWEDAFSLIRIFVKSGRPVKVATDVSKDVLVEFTFDDTTALEWVDENHYVGERDTKDPGDLSAFGGF